MTKRTGRALSAIIIDRLRDSLSDGRPRTYDELARACKCTTRSVRNYLDDAAELLGFPVVREVGAGRKIFVRAAHVDTQSTIDELAQSVARAMLRNIFPIAGTSLDRAKRSSKAHVLVSVRGVYEYEERHLQALRKWLQWSTLRPRHPVSFHYDGESRGLREVWPLGVVIRNLARVYLIGMPTDAFDATDVRTYALERATAFKQKADSFDVPPKKIDRAAIEDSMDLPFSLSPGDNGMHAHLRFAPNAARFVRHRHWHRRQKTKEGRDGSLELRFGPVVEHELLSWLREWGDQVSVLGDSALVRAHRKG